MFENFNKTDKAQWAEKATKDLKGEDVYAKFDWQIGNVTLHPYYDRNDLENKNHLELFENRLATIDDPSGDPRVWANMQRIEVATEIEANKQALEALTNGAEGVEFVISESTVDIAKLLQGILLDHCHVALHLSNAEQAADFLKYIIKQNASNKSIYLLLEAAVETDLLDLLSITNHDRGFRLITIESISTSEPTEQIASILKEANKVIRNLLLRGIGIDEAIDTITLSVEVGNDFFVEIAKIRALRLLFFQLARAYQYEGFQPEDMHIKCISTSWKDEAYAPHENMLKNSTAALAAILGGCNSLISLPEKNSPLETRIARNVSSIIKEEAYLSKIADPVAGSYFIESVTDKLAKTSWTLFQQELKKEITNQAI